MTAVVSPRSCLCIHLQKLCQALPPLTHVHRSACAHMAPVVYPQGLALSLPAAACIDRRQRQKMGGKTSEVRSCL